jgi:uncharacterized integral membrane protein
MDAISIIYIIMFMLGLIFYAITTASVLINIFSQETKVETIPIICLAVLSIMNFIGAGLMMAYKIMENTG